MKGKIQALLIKTVFNNQGWQTRCKNPLKDHRCYMCFKGVLQGINGGNPIVEDENGLCYGDFGSYALAEDSWCWEQTLCSKFYWRNVKGKWRYVTEGMPVYFVYPELDKSLTLWGRSVIEKIDNENELPTLHFEPFTPLASEKWVQGLSGKEITGAHFKQGHYRYLDDRHEKYMAALFAGQKKVDKKSNAIPTVTGYESVNVLLRGDILKKIEKIANIEGRELSELIREAVAKLVHERGL